MHNRERIKIDRSAVSFTLVVVTIVATIDRERERPKVMQMKKNKINK